MSELLLELIRTGGPLFGPLLFIIAIFLTGGYHSMLRQVAIRNNRICLALVDKGYFTLKELRDYGMLHDVGDMYSAWEGIV